MNDQEKALVVQGASISFSLSQRIIVEESLFEDEVGCSNGALIVCTV
jgi:hypothetical protein